MNLSAVERAWELDRALETVVRDLHRVIGTALFELPVAPEAGHGDRRALDRDLDVLRLDASERVFDDPAVARAVNVGARPPVRLGDAVRRAEKHRHLVGF